MLGVSHHESAMCISSGPAPTLLATAVARQLGSRQVRSGSRPLVVNRGADVHPATWPSCKGLVDAYDDRVIDESP